MNEKATQPNTEKRHARVDVADVLRGIAVLAIILLHFIEHFNFYSFPDAESRPEWLAFLDKAVWDSLFFTFAGKAYAMFALLFGFSFFIQHDNQRMRGKDFRIRFCWRLFLLFCIGNFNAVFFTGEILVLYSLVGFVLVLTCRLSNRILVWLAAICILQPVCIWQIAGSILSPGYEPMTIKDAPLWAATFDAQSNADFITMVKTNLVEGQLASLAWAWNHGRVFQTAGIFMIGMLIGRQGWFGKQYIDKWGKALAIALICFFPLHGLNQMVPDYISDTRILAPLQIVLSSLANLSFMVVLASGIIYGYYCTKGISRVLSKIIPYGKMSMTNYVTQGIVGSFLFYHWGLFLHLGISESVACGILVFIVQYAFCRFWVGRHSHGPLEYIWRRLTWI